MRKFSVLIAILLLFVLVFSAVSAQDVGPIVQRILDRGEMICGGNANLVGFGSVNDAGEYEGFDIDICRAVAAAILGDANAISVRPLAGGDRQVAIQSEEVDMMSRNTTVTLSRDTEWGAIFAPVTFYDGQGVGTRVELGVSSIAELDGSSMCVQSGTTTELDITTYFQANGLDIELKVFPDATATWEAYVSGACESWTTDKSGLASYHVTAENPSEHMILPETISKQPLAPLSPQSDPQFAEIIAWTVWGMIEAEEQGITSENIDEFLTSENPAIQRLLGLNNNVTGEHLGIANDFMVTVIRQVGNYGEVFDRNLTPLGLPRGLNALWTDGGLMYAPPFS